MDSFVVNVGRDGRDVSIRVAVRLLLIADEMLLLLSAFLPHSSQSKLGQQTHLDARDDPGGLHSHHSLVGELSGEIRVVGKSLPVSATRCDTSQGAHDWAKENIRTFLVEFLAHPDSALVGKFSVP